MGLSAIGVRRRGARSPEPAAEFEPGPWGIAAVAWVVSALCRRPIGPEQARDQAFGLGLFRLPRPGEVALLAAMAVSRLFLAGYGLPAAATGSVPTLQEHLGAGRRVFVVLDRGTENADGVFE